MNFNAEKVANQIIAISDEFEFEIFDIACLLLPYVPYRPIGNIERPSYFTELILPYLRPDHLGKRINYEKLESDHQGESKLIEDFHDFTFRLLEKASARTVFEKYLLFYMMSENNGIPGLKARELGKFTAFLREYEFDFRVALSKVPNKYKENVKKITIFELLEAYYYHINDRERKGKIVDLDYLKGVVLGKTGNPIFGQLRNPMQVVDREEIIKEEGLGNLGIKGLDRDELDDMGRRLELEAETWTSGQGEEI